MCMEVPKVKGREEGPLTLCMEVPKVKGEGGGTVNVVHGVT